MSEYYEKFMAYKKCIVVVVSSLALMVIFGIIILVAPIPYEEKMEKEAGSLVKSGYVSLIIRLLDSCQANERRFLSMRCLV